MCITNPNLGADPQPITTNLGVGRCAGTAAAGAELHEGHHHGSHRTLVPANVAAAAEGGDDAGSGGAGFELMYAVSDNDYTVCTDIQMMMQEFVADPEGRVVSVRRMSGSE